MSTAKELIEAFAKRQHEWHYPCPRCGRDVMDEEPARNAMSRRVNVQVCDDCGTLEAFEDMPGGLPGPAGGLGNHEVSAPLGDAPAACLRRPR